MGLPGVSHGLPETKTNAPIENNIWCVTETGEGQSSSEHTEAELKVSVPLATVWEDCLRGESGPRAIRTDYYVANVNLV